MARVADGGEPARRAARGRVLGRRGGRHHRAGHRPRARAGPALVAHLRLDRSPEADRAHPRLADHGLRRAGTAALAVPYSPGTYAWWQVVTLALASPDQDLVVVDPTDLDGWVEAAVRHGVTAASGTPTFWRQTMMAQRDRLAEVPFEQITLGGEPVDQAVLDKLKAIFPERQDLLDLRVLRARRLDRGARRPRRVPGRVAGARGGRTAAARGHRRRAGDRLPAPRRRSGRGGAHRGRRRDRGRPGGDHRPGRTATRSTSAAPRSPPGSSVPSCSSTRPWPGPRSVAGGPRWWAAWWWPTWCWGPVFRSHPELLAELTAWCAARLPEYGVPRRITVLDEIDSTETGKVRPLAAGRVTQPTRRVPGLI